MIVSAPRLDQALDATWPAAATRACGPFTLREGRGGGKRVSAATLDAASFDAADLDAAEAGMAALGQGALFRVRAGDTALDTGLDAALAARGYGIVDPVMIHAGPVADVAGPGAEPMSAFTIWPRLKISEDIWAACGIGPERLAVMDRVSQPRTTILSRRADRAVGMAFVALAGDIAMIHAIEVLPAWRRQGSAVNMMRAAAVWAQDHGAQTLACAVTSANTGARALYASLNMQNVGYCHYRAK
jgi:ribosomal protein S18 acetylase RimI-like enzyme